MRSKKIFKIQVTALEPHVLPCHAFAATDDTVVTAVVLPLQQTANSSMVELIKRIARSCDSTTSEPLCTGLRVCEDPWFEADGMLTSDVSGSDSLNDADSARPVRLHSCWPWRRMTGSRVVSPGGLVRKLFDKASQTGAVSIKQHPRSQSKSVSSYLKRTVFLGPVSATPIL